MTVPNPAGKLARLGEGKVFMILGMPHIMRLFSDENATGTSLMEVVVGSGQGVPRHIHTREDEIFCLVLGEVTCQVDGLPSPVTLKPGDSLFLPRNRAHSFTNASTQEARMLAMVMPGTGTDQMFADMDAACRKSSDPKQLIAEVGRIGANCGIQFG